MSRRSFALIMPSSLAIETPTSGFRSLSSGNRTST